MAIRKFTRGARPSRNRVSQGRSRRTPGAASAASPKSVHPIPEPVHAAIEAGRARLMRARAVLECMHYVLLHEEDSREQDPQPPSFCDAVAVASDLVDEVIEALDRVNLRAAGS